MDGSAFVLGFLGVVALLCVVRTAHDVWRECRRRRQVSAVRAQLDEHPAAPADGTTR